MTRVPRRALPAGDLEAALRACLDILVRMDPAATAAHGLEQCTDDEYLCAVGEAARALHGIDPAAWPGPIRSDPNHSHDERTVRQRWPACADHGNPVNSDDADRV
jgi:hypothetical protein